MTGDSNHHKSSHKSNTGLELLQTPQQDWNYNLNLSKSNTGFVSRSLCDAQAVRSGRKGRGSESCSPLTGQWDHSNKVYADSQSTVSSGSIKHLTGWKQHSSVHRPVSEHFCISFCTKRSKQRKRHLQLRSIPPCRVAAPGGTLLFWVLFAFHLPWLRGEHHLPCIWERKASQVVAAASAHF